MVEMERKRGGTVKTFGYRNIEVTTLQRYKTHTHHARDVDGRESTKPNQTNYAAAVNVEL